MHDHLLVAILALCLNAVFAGPRSWLLASGLSSLFQFPAHVLRTLERKLNRDHRSEKERETRGILLVTMVVIDAVVLGYVLAWLCSGNLGFVELLIVAACVPVRACVDIGLAIHKQLQAGDIAKARQALEGTPWKHHALLDEFGVARAAIELAAVHWACKIVAPLFWYVLLGLPGLLLSKLVYLLQEVISPANQPVSSFAKATVGLNHFLHVVPVRLAAYICLIASLFLPSGKWREASARMAGGWRASLHQVALLGFAAVLGISLGGPSSAYLPGQWVEAGTVRTTAHDVKRALVLLGLSCLLLLVFFGLLL